VPVILCLLSTKPCSPLAGLRDRPDLLTDYVRRVVEEYEGARLVDIYFSVGSETACAVIENLDDYVAAKAVFRTLGAVRIEKALRAEQAAAAVAKSAKHPPIPPASPGRAPAASRASPTRRKRASS
jgi:uncharacterized protein with GYD domain